MSKRSLLLVAAHVTLLAITATSCVTQNATFRAGDDCVAGQFTVSDQFSAARRGRCTVLADDHVRLSILPEDDGYINNSPWYSFKIQAMQPTTAKITLRYQGGEHRYQPKLSDDGLRWRVIDEQYVTVSADKTTAQISLPVGGQPVWISAQEILTPQMYDAWMQKYVTQGKVDIRAIGQSRGQRPIHLLSSAADTDDVLLLVGRQHPPEVTGALAFLVFYETLMSDTDLALAFRQQFQIVAVPLMNPDGVIDGNWRHNRGGTDLNRDWGPFKQPETQAIARLLDQLDANDKNIRVFLDFHSTQKNVFYTQDEASEHSPPRFTRTWLDNARPRIEAMDEPYAFDNQENTTEKEGVSKNYIYHRYGIPASTYELGDETDRTAIRKASVIFAEELMKLMLEQDY